MVGKIQAPLVRVDFVQDTDGTIYIADGPNKAIHKVTIGYK